MSITVEEKARVIKEFGTAAGDTGSPEVQVALLSERISNLTEHLKTHAKDFHSRRGLLMLVGRRRRLLETERENECVSERAFVEDVRTDDNGNGEESFGFFF